LLFITMRVIAHRLLHKFHLEAAEKKNRRDWVKRIEIRIRSDAQRLPSGQETGRVPILNQCENAT
jgi:hypothetical protein